MNKNSYKEVTKSNYEAFKVLILLDILITLLLSGNRAKILCLGMVLYTSMISLPTCYYPLYVYIV